VKFVFEEHALSDWFSSNYSLSR